MADQVLDGKTVIVTGAGRGLGLTMALALLRAGAKVAMVEHDGDALDEGAGEAREAGGADAVLPIVADVTDEEAAAGVMSAAIEQFARPFQPIAGAESGVEGDDPGREGE